jgi:hypothetical protein
MFSHSCMRDGLGIDSSRMGPGHPTKVLGKRSVPVELDYSINPGDWDKPLNGVLFGLWPHTTQSPQTNKQTKKKKKKKHVLICCSLRTAHVHCCSYECSLVSCHSNRVTAVLSEYPENIQVQWQDTKLHRGRIKHECALLPC